MKSAAKVSSHPQGKGTTSIHTALPHDKITRFASPNNYNSCFSPKSFLDSRNQQRVTSPHWSFYPSKKSYKLYHDKPVPENKQQPTAVQLKHVSLLTHNGPAVGTVQSRDTAQWNNHVTPNLHGEVPHSDKITKKSKIIPEELNVSWSPVLSTRFPHEMEGISPNDTPADHLTSPPRANLKPTVAGKDSMLDLVMWSLLPHRWNVHRNASLKQPREVSPLNQRRSKTFWRQPNTTHSTGRLTVGAQNESVCHSRAFVWTNLFRKHSQSRKDKSKSMELHANQPADVTPALSCKYNNNNSQPKLLKYLSNSFSSDSPSSAAVQQQRHKVPNGNLMKEDNKVSSDELEEGHETVETLLPAVGPPPSYLHASVVLFGYDASRFRRSRTLSDEGEKGGGTRPRLAMHHSLETILTDKDNKLTQSITPILPDPLTDTVVGSELHIPHQSLTCSQTARPATPVHDGDFYLLQVADVELELMRHVALCQSDLEKPSIAVPEEVEGELRATIGKARLLVDDKFRQFRKLCEQNMREKASRHDENAGRLTLDSDLEGFWAMVQLQVDQVRREFHTLNTLRERHWVPASPPVVRDCENGVQPSHRRPTGNGMMGRRHTAPFITPCSDRGPMVRSSKEKNDQRAAEARKRVQAMKRAAMESKMKVEKQHRLCVTLEEPSVALV